MRLTPSASIKLPCGVNRRTVSRKFSGQALLGSTYFFLVGDGPRKLENDPELVLLRRMTCGRVENAGVVDEELVVERFVEGHPGIEISRDDVGADEVVGSTVGIFELVPV